MNSNQSRSKKILTLALAGLFATHAQMTLAQNSKKSKECEDINALDCISGGDKDVRASQPRAKASKEEVERKLQEYRGSLADSAGGLIQGGTATPVVPVSTKKPAVVIAPNAGQAGAASGVTSSQADLKGTPGGNQTNSQTGSPSTKVVNKDVPGTTADSNSSQNVSEKKEQSTGAAPVANTVLTSRALSHINQAIAHLKNGALADNLTGEVPFAHQDLVDALSATPKPNMDLSRYNAMSISDAASALLNGHNDRVAIEGESKVGVQYYVPGEGRMKFNVMSARVKETLERTLSVLQDLVDGKLKSPYTATDYINRAIALNGQIMLLHTYMTAERTGSSGRGDPFKEQYVEGARCGYALIEWNMPGTVENPKGVSTCRGTYDLGPKDSTYPNGTRTLVKSEAVFNNKTVSYGEVNIECTNGQWVIVHPEKASCKAAY